MTVGTGRWGRLINRYKIIINSKKCGVLLYNKVATDNTLYISKILKRDIISL